MLLNRALECWLCAVGWLSVVCLAEKAEMPYRPMGISLEMLPFYKPDAQGMFSCIDGSQKIPFDQVNDDYCDCADSSDEPGTSACSEGRFVCANHGYIPVTILSSRVNDHVCDCCDGSDEYNSGQKCANTCVQERQKQMKQFRTFNEGYQKRQQHIQQAKKDLEEKRKKVEELSAKISTEQVRLEELQKVRDEAEVPEKEGKEKYDQMLKEMKEKHELDKMTAQSAEAFREVDTDADEKLSLQELLTCASIDGTNQCGVSEDEMKEWFPVDQTALSLDQFRQFIWIEKLDQHFKSRAEKEREALDKETEKIEEDSNKGEYDETKAGEKEEEDYNDDTDYDFPDEHPKHADNVAKRKDFPKELQFPEMDEELVKLIETARVAREKYKEQEKVKQDIENEKSDLEKDLDLDVGPEKEFQHLLKQCFEFQQKEYTYIFCPFDKGAQKPKSGGETSLGRWGEWSGPPDHKYTQMKLTKGQRCWNGPDRSLTINFECGPEDKILATSEPSMCEYLMQFSTPALCTKFYDFDHEKRVHEDL